MRLEENITVNCMPQYFSLFLPFCDIQTVNALRLGISVRLCIGERRYVAIVSLHSYCLSVTQVNELFK